MIVTVTLNPSLDEWMSLPSLRTGKLNRASGFARYPGGKGINVSRVVHELGGRTMAFGIAGGEDGLILRQLMSRLTIPHQFVNVQGSTRNNYKIHTSLPRALTEINTAGPKVGRAALLALKALLFRKAPVASCVVLSGSLPPGAPSDIYCDWIQLLRRRGIPTALDASGSALRRGLAGMPWLIKPNRDEAQELLQRRLTNNQQMIRAARELLQLGVALVVLSLGKKGALMASRLLPGVWWARPPVIKADSAVGAGDSLIGGFLVGWARRQPLLESFRLGVACGTATAMAPGTELCHRADVHRLLRRIAIKRIS
jgi:6-phosphofructokinase 2